MANTRTETGSRVVLKVGGRIVGDIERISINSRQALEPNDPIGQAEVAEYVDTGYKVEGTLVAFRVFRQNLIAAGIDPDKTTLTNLISRPETFIEVFDILEGVTIERLTGVKFETHGREYAKNSLSKRNISFKAIMDKSEDNS